MGISKIKSKKMSKLFILSVILVVSAVNTFYGKLNCNLTKSNRCGPYFNNQVCGKGKYCSRYSYCGSSSYYIHNHVARYSNMYGCCLLQSGDHRCGPSYGHRSCGAGKYCSPWGWCTHTMYSALSNYEHLKLYDNNCGQGLAESEEPKLEEEAQPEFAQPELAQPEFAQPEEDVPELAQPEEAVPESLSQCNHEVGSRCGPLHNYQVCGAGRWCSQWGYCGDTWYHWKDHLARYSLLHGCCLLANNHRCGANFEGRSCPAGRYCTDNENGYCAFLKFRTVDPKYSNNCGLGLAESKEPKLKDEAQLEQLSQCNHEVGSRCGPQHNNQVCGDGRYCSPWGWCGSESAYQQHQLAKYSNLHGCGGCRQEKDNRCGPYNEGRSCAAGRYCTPNGWCTAYWFSTVDPKYSNNCGLGWR